MFYSDRYLLHALRVLESNKAFKRCSKISGKSKKMVEASEAITFPSRAAFREWSEGSEATSLKVDYFGCVLYHHGYHSLDTGSLNNLIRERKSTGASKQPPA